MLGQLLGVILLGAVILFAARVVWLYFERENSRILPIGDTRDMRDISQPHGHGTDVLP